MVEQGNGKSVEFRLAKVNHPLALIKADRFEAGRFHFSCNLAVAGQGARQGHTLPQEAKPANFPGGWLANTRTFPIPSCGLFNSVAVQVSGATPHLNHNKNNDSSAW